MTGLWKNSKKETPGRIYRVCRQNLIQPQKELREAETNLTSLVLPLSNYLSRIKKLHESGKYTLKPEVKKQLDLCLKDPVAVDPSFFPELQKIFEDNTLDMQAQKKEKALSQVKTATSSFPERKETYLKGLTGFSGKKSSSFKL